MKVGLIDFGFQDLPGYPLSSDIKGALCFQPTIDPSGRPIRHRGEPTHDIKDCQQVIPITPNDHGSLNVEALHRIAENAEVYITNPIHQADIPMAINWLIEQEVDVIIKTHGWPWEGAGDGKPFRGVLGRSAPEEAYIHNAVKKATDAGIAWVQGSGSEAKHIWTGPFNDADEDGWHNFTDDDECNDVGLEAGKFFYPWLRWQDAYGNPQTMRDLGIYLLPRSGDVNLPDLTQMTSEEKKAFDDSAIKDIFLSTTGRLTGMNQRLDYPFPLEGLLVYLTRQTDTYCVAVNNISETKQSRLPNPDWIQMQLWEAPHGGNYVEHSAPEARSLAEPADADDAGMLVVGSATRGDSSAIADYSGRGPTLDGRIKPDVVGSPIQAGEGQSIEAAAVMGAVVALVRQRFPEMTNVQVNQYLKDNAIPRGDTVPNNTWGYGYANLPHPCENSISIGESKQGAWHSYCVSDKMPTGGNAGVRHMSMYEFNLAAETEVTITLESSEDTYLYLLDASGSVLDENDDIEQSVNLDSRITRILRAGVYKIEATTFEPGVTGDFTLSLGGQMPAPPPTPKYKAISSGAAHVCALPVNGSIMCWGDDSEGQVSERPRSGVFTAISSGDYHTCALRDDGMVVCWGSITLP